MEMHTLTEHLLCLMGKREDKSWPLTSMMLFPEVGVEPTEHWKTAVGSVTAEGWPQGSLSVTSTIQSMSGEN